MSANWSLRNRLAITLAVFSAVVSVALATAIYVSSLDLEARLIDETLNAELDDYVARRQRNPQSLPEKTATIRAYVVAAQGGTQHIPDAVSQLVPGRHEVTLDGVIYRAAVRQVGEQRFVVLYDTSQLRQREQGFLLLLIASVGSVTVISAMAGSWLAARVIAPVNLLARRVSEMHPEDESEPLAEEFPWIEVRRLAEEFDTYLHRLHDFIERERLFTGDVSHELRTPLSIINGATELMLADEGLDEKNSKRVLRIARAATEMHEITAALLALAREQHDASSRSVECDVESVAQEVISRYREIFQHKPITIRLEVKQPLMLRVDHAILSMVLGNLLRNALSFSEQGEVVVRIEENSIAVEDNGPGLGTSQPEQLFQPYVRGGHGNGGTGLGLSLVWRLCELSGWHIELQNRPQGGTLARLQFTPASGNSAS
jgi:signal transduction histidine kinase